jgi:apolipoprotein N-acyltransferase
LVVTSRVPAVAAKSTSAVAALDPMNLRVYQKEIVYITLFSFLHSLIFHFSFLWWLAFFSLIPLFLCLERLKSRREVLIFGYLGGVLWTLATFYWVYFVAAAGWLCLGIYLGIYVPLFCLLSYKSILILKDAGSALRFAWVKVFSVAAVWVLIEFLRSHVPIFRFPWALMGYSQWKNIVFIQSADFFGAYGLSFLIVLVNACLYLLIHIIKRLMRKEIRPKIALLRAITPVLVLLLVMGGNIFYGQWRLQQTESNQPRVLVSVVQGNIPQHEKWNESIKDTIFRKYEGLSRQVGLDKPDLVIWPETAFPGYWEDEPEMTQRFKKLVNAVRTRFLIGAPTWTRRGEGFNRMNSAVYFNEKGRELGRYHKLRLVPFGEYIPFFGFLRQFFPIGRFAPGREMVIFDLPLADNKKAKFSTLICFEDIFPDLCRKNVRSGSNLLINITNDAWFLKSTAPYQHAQASVLRAVENRVPVVRAANTGFSCYIDQWGVIHKTVHDGDEDLFVTGFATDEITLGERNSLYTQWGDFMTWVCLLIVLATFPLYLGKVNYPSSLETEDVGD